MATAGLLPASTVTVSPVLAQLHADRYDEVLRATGSTRSLEEPRDRARLVQVGQVSSQVGGVTVVGTSLSHRYPGPLGEVSGTRGRHFRGARGWGTQRWWEPRGAGK